MGFPKQTSSAQNDNNADKALRITSYNVCYTKLLRPIVLHELSVWLTQFPSVPTPEQALDPNAKKILIAPVSAEVTE